MNAYTLCMILGLAFPIISLIFNFFDSAFDAIAVDFLDLDVGDLDICFLPLSFNAICMGAITFGGVGLLMLDKSSLQRNLVAGILGYVSAVIIQSLIKYLKKHSTDAKNINKIVGKQCIISNRVPEHGFGAIVYKEDGQADISMPAKSEDNLVYEQGTKVIVVDIKDQTAIVQKIDD